MNIRTIVLGLCLIIGYGAHAHDFTSIVKGQRLYFEIIDSAKHTAAVTYNGSITDHVQPELSGDVVIPAKVKHGNMIYTVKAINPKAFANSKRLKSVVMPSGLERIGDFAFEHCDSLSSIVFPGNSVTLGEGIFFNCPAISEVTIGSDWRSVDLTMFRWSNSLSNITIPAKIAQIKGLKKLKNLTSITVDPNNSTFMAEDGMLYSKNGTIFYACPRAHDGTVVVREGTTTIHPGALIDCTGITGLDLPGTLKNISFRETSRMKQLANIVVRSTQPVITGYYNGYGKFFFQLPNSKTEIIIPASAKNAYLDLLPTMAGEYRETPEGIPYVLTKSELPTKKNIKSVKKINTYQL